MLNLMKLAVGARDIAHVREFQAERAAREPPLRHRTRHFPRRAEELIAGGSIYWVVAGAMVDVNAFSTWLRSDGRTVRPAPRSCSTQNWSPWRRG